MESILKEFFAVTETSVYLVSSDRNEHGWPIVEKIALRGNSRVAVGKRLNNGHYVGILKSGIALYDSNMGRKETPKPEFVNIAFWGGHTSPIVALFLNKEKAMECFSSENQKNCDPRWREQTEETIKSIGEDHPVFILSQMEAFTFK